MCNIIKNRLCILFSLLFIFTVSHNSLAQIKEIEEMWKNQVESDTSKITLKKPVYLKISENEVLNLFNRQPSFGMYRDNYIITGIPIGKEINRFTTDVKFQISIQQRLTKSVLPLKSFLMLTYTQKSFWDLYADSAPFTDNNYNPGLTLVKPIISKEKLRGMALFALEHESNGKDSTDSRSTNYFVLTGIYFFNESISVQGKLWAGWLGNENKDLYSKYRGYGLFVLNYRSIKDKFWISAVINPRGKIGNFNTQLELNFKLHPKENQYFFIQWYNGYGESMIKYKQYTSMLRIGICMKPPLRNLY